ncbi:hypothetical protein CASFOL_001247 [Castilleja foliolosa]|uniref:Uncharacterized protein n=1 Tax=Castilleja foliolosa TaxID=1961234 RepID=A0ABD3EMJ5_9LAMI
MSAAEEEWVKAALTDDTMVVELLVRLHGAAAEESAAFRPPAPPLEWSVRQRRSRHVSSNIYPKKQAQRLSPTTPLSWSGATSPSGGSGGAGDEGSSRPDTHKLLSATRSKVNGDSEKTVLKRTRKKKTLAQLKDEESSLLKERRVLKRELIALRGSLEKQRATNENLKRIKIELQPSPDTETTSLAAEESNSDHLATGDTIVPENIPLQSSTSNGCPEPNPVAATDSKFVVPDLNMPFEEDLNIVCGVS